jgi:hypothetical protein
VKIINIIRDTDKNYAPANIALQNHKNNTLKQLFEAFQHVILESCLRYRYQKENPLGFTESVELEQHNGLYTRNSDTDLSISFQRKPQAKP